MLTTFSKSEITELLQDAGADIPQCQLDEMAVPSYLHSNPLIGWLLRKRHHAILNVAQLAGNESVLDFGCGIGLLLPTLCERARNVHATDLVPKLAEYLARKNHLPVTFHSSDRLDQTLPDTSLDVIIAQESMEHLDDPGHYISLFQRKLKPNGRLVMSGPTENLVYRIGRLIAGFGGKQGYHRCSVDQLDSLLRSAGWERSARQTLPFHFPPHIYKIASYRRLRNAS